MADDTTFWISRGVVMAIGVLIMWPFAINFDWSWVALRTFIGIFICGFISGEISNRLKTREKAKEIIP